MPGKPIRTSNRFGRRFIKPKELLDYAKDLGLTLPAGIHLEFLEKEGLLEPICRVRYPAPIVRRLAKEERDRHPSEEIIEPIELDDDVVRPAAELHGELCFPTWNMPYHFGEKEHILDALAPDHATFIQTEFSSSTFVAWDDLKVWTFRINGSNLYGGDRFYPTYYHGWQVFILQAYLRSCAKIFYPVNDDEVAKAISNWDVSNEEVRSRIKLNINLEARHELNDIKQHSDYFDAVNYFEAYRHNAFELFREHIDDDGRLSQQHWNQYRKRQGEIAKTALEKYCVTPDEVIDFIATQCKWWNDASHRGLPILADEWKRHIGITLDCHHAATNSNFDEIVDQVGRVTGHQEPTLRVIFPSWLLEQRELVQRSMEHWLAVDLSNLSPPFELQNNDIGEFCDWLEAKGLYQFYWCYRRFVDAGGRDDPIQRSATSADASSFANLVEMIANAVLVERGKKVPRGDTLVPKLREIFGPNGPEDFNSHFTKHRELMKTVKQSLQQRLSQIARIKKSGGNHVEILKALLSLVAIRNEGTHIGLLSFDHAEQRNLLRLMSIASFAIWKAK